MNKVLQTFLFVALAGILISSCNKNNDSEKPSITGEWTTIERSISTNNDFLNESINNLFALDNKDYIVKRIFTQTDENIGAIETIAINKKTGNEDRNRSGSYKIEGDSLHIDDQKFEQTTSRYRIDGKVLLTYTKVKKKELDYIVSELGGDPNLIPDDAEGLLRMKEIK